MYDRDVKYLPPRPVDGLRYRIETLVGVTGFKLAKYRTGWVEAISAPFKLFWRPHLLGILIFEVPRYFLLRYHFRSTKRCTGCSVRFLRWNHCR